MSPARLTVLSGPTAVGKGTVVARLAAEHPDIFVSVSATTRPPRPGEVHGQHYLFVTPAEFDALIAEGALLEWAVVHGEHRYGTPRAPVLAALAEGRPALLEIDLQGARQVRASWPSATFVFLAPPSGRSWCAGWWAAAPRPPSSGSSGWPRRGPSWRPAWSSNTWW